MTKKRRMLFAAVVALAPVAGGCGAVRTVGAPRLVVEYYDPAESLGSPVAAATVTLQKDNDMRNRNVDVEVYAPGDSAVLLVMRDSVPWSDLEAAIGSEGASHVRRSFGNTTPWVPVAIELRPERIATLVPRLINAVEVGEHADTLRGQPAFCVFRPDRNVTVRFHQTVYPTPETASRRYRLRVNWIKFKADTVRLAKEHICAPAGASLGLGSLGLQNEVRAAAGEWLDAFARSYDLPLVGVAALAVVLFGGIVLIAGS